MMQCQCAQSYLANRSRSCARIEVEIVYGKRKVVVHKDIEEGKARLTKSGSGGSNNGSDVLGISIWKRIWRVSFGS